jgi:simple sugar transport system substrate-binding protein
MPTRRLFLAIAALGLGLAPAAAEPKLKVGFVYVGPAEDYGWSYQHDLGRRAVEAAYPGRVETTFVASVKEGPDTERVVEQLARTGHKLIFSTSFGFMEPTLKVAARHPEVKFEHCTGYKRAANVSTYAGRFYEGRYVMGQIAAKLSKSAIVGYIGSFPIPEVVSGINAFMLGAQSIRPDMKVKVVWANSWFDPGKEADAAKALIDQGADIITQHTDSPAPMQVAEQRGVKAFGQDSDMARFGPKAQLTALMDNWSDYYVRRVGQVLDGSWVSTDTWDGLASGMVKMAPYANMPDAVKALAHDTEGKIKSGTVHPFKCPVLKQDGTEVECKGAGVLADAQILGMDFYVKGIDDKLPGK